MFIDIKDARKHYGEGETLVNALDGVSLSLGEGKIYVILGPSGSGKSTLLNMIGGLDSLDSGEITISGRNISRSDKKKMTDYRREDVGFVFQFYNLIPDLTVQENIQVVADIAKNPKILLCDELTGALDSKSSRNVLKFIEKVNEQFKTTIIIITHNEAIADMADTVIRIKDGQVASCTDNNSKHSAEELEL